MTDTIVFDLDGTLLNTLDDLMDSTNYALLACGFPARGYEEIRSFVGNGVGLLIERACPADASKAQVADCLKLFTAHYDKNKSNKTRPYDGIAEMLAQVRARGFKSAVVSNKYDAAVKELVFSLFGEWIDEAIGESADVRKKPAPDGVAAALKRLNSDKKSAVYVGDSDVDAQTAKNAKMKFIGVTWGFRDRALLERMGADAIIDAPSELFEALEKI